MSLPTQLDQVSVGHEVSIPCGRLTLEGTLSVPQVARGLVLFVHGSGSSRYSPRNRFVVRVLESDGIAILLFDLLTHEEERVDRETAQYRFDTQLLTTRLMSVTDWASNHPETQSLRIGYFGASTGAAAALAAAAQLPGLAAAVVCRGGRPDLAAEFLDAVRAPTLFIVGEHDEAVIDLNRAALAQLRNLTKELAIIPGATHLFEEMGALEKVARLAAEWFAHYLAPPVGATDLRERHDPRLPN